MKRVMSRLFILSSAAMISIILRIGGF